MVGIPGSGKSYYAKLLAKKNPNTHVRVCRDDIREMLGKYWVPKREKLVTDIEYDTMYSALSRGYNVIVDATNINADTIRKLKDVVRQMNNSQDEYEFEYDEHIMTTPLWKCIWRNIYRSIFGGRFVPIKVIKNFYKRQYE